MLQAALLVYCSFSPR